MAETAVGLFQNSSIANIVADALRNNGLPATGIQVISEATNLPVDNMTSTPGTDRSVALARELRAMGATETESELYVAGVSRGNAIVFATGTAEQAAIATDLMNEHFAIEVEEFAGSVPALEPVVAGSVGGPNVTEKIEHHRNRTEGAKIFAW